LGVLDLGRQQDFIYALRLGLIEELADFAQAQPGKRARGARQFRRGLLLDGEDYRLNRLLARGFQDEKRETAVSGDDGVAVLPVAVGIHKAKIRKESCALLHHPALRRLDEIHQRPDMSRLQALRFYRLERLGCIHLRPEQKPKRFVALLIALTRHTISM